MLPTKPEKKPLLRGWAIVDNTVGEDWNDVELSLVAGAPHSFIQQLSEPYYGRRPVVQLPENVQLAPQTHAATLSGGNGRLSGQATDPSGAVIAGANVRLLDENGAVVATTSTDSNGNYTFSSLSVGNYRVDFQHSGFKQNEVSQLAIGPGENQLNSQLQVGAATETVMVTAAPGATLNTESAEVSSTTSLGVANRPHVNFGALTGHGFGSGSGGGMMSTNAIEAGREMTSAAASGQSLGDLFEYKLKTALP